MSCKNCQYGPYDSLSDICDGCRNDPDTGWGGFTDHKLGKHFYSDEERDNYEKDERQRESDLAGADEYDEED